LNVKKKETKKQKMILVTGTPGVGKTAVSRLLASKLNALHIDLGELVKRENLTSGIDKVRDSLIADINEVSTRVQEIIKKCDRNVIIDGHYAVDVVLPDSVDFVFVLRRNPDELKKAMEERGFREEKIYENLAAEILDVCLVDAISACGSEKVCEIDTSDRDIEEVVGDVFLILKGKKKCQIGIVDWLGKLEAENRLRLFLRDF
jgi:adenylate kinase